MCFFDQDEKVSILAESVEKNKRTQNHNNKQPTLSAHGFTEAKWWVASKSNDSYTKREVVEVQGAQQ